MEHLLEAWPRIRESVIRSRVLLLLDFDGTLAPIAARPSAATLAPRTRDLLRRLNEKEWCSVGIISGRSLRGLKSKVRLDGLIYGGNHGAQLSGPGFDFQAPLPQTAPAIRAIASDLGRLRTDVKGTIIEDKETSLSVHFRNVDGDAVPVVRERVFEAVRPFLSTGLLRVREGKKVLDITPCAWDKGKAVTWLVGRVKSAASPNGRILPVYVGDDTTDEDAFEALGENGLAVRVGNEPSSKARYYLKDVNEVRRFLVYVIVDGRS